MNYGFRQRLICGVMILFIGANSVPAWAQVNTYRAVSFGDSMTDNEYLYLIFGTDPAIYGADPFEAMFNKSAHEGDELANYAVLGSTSADVLLQIETYAAAREAGLADQSTIASIQAGANDFLDPVNLFYLASAPPGQNADADVIVDGIKKNLLSCLQTIKKVDKAQIILWTVPDVTLLPYAQLIGLGGVAAENVRLHIQRLNHFIRAMGLREQIAVLDISAILSDAIALPPVIAGVPLLPPPYFGISVAIFADPLHPTAVSNGILANAMILEANETFDDAIPFYSEEELAVMAGLIPTP